MHWRSPNNRKAMREMQPYLGDVIGEPLPPMRNIPLRTYQSPRWMNSGFQALIGWLAIGLWIAAILIGVVMGFILFPSQQAKGAVENECPPERPIARYVIDSTRPVMCTLILCPGKLFCPADETKPCQRLPSNDCNICSAPTYLACFSKDEIDRATEGLQ